MTLAAHRREPFRPGTEDPVVPGSTPAAEASCQNWLPRPGARLAAFSRMTRRFPMIASCLDAGEIAPLEWPHRAVEGILGWGDRLPARVARHLAERRGLPFWALEDGFLRSAGLGKQGAASVSLIADDLGVHFSPERPSRLEELLNRRISAAQLTRARDFREQIVRERLTKYNHLPDRPAAIASSSRRRILLVDQVRGDRSAGPAARATVLFAAMWQAARQRPDAQILVRGHPDVLAGTAKSQLAPLVQGQATWLDEPICVHAVLDCVDEVWTVSSQLGIDALMRGLPVTTFGAPAYAGWGLTEDRAEGAFAAAAFARRRRRLSVDDFVAAAFLAYPIYYDPVRRRRIEPEAAVERLLSLRRHALERTGRHLAIGFARHKRGTLRRFVEGPAASIAFASRRVSRRRMAAADRILIWGAGDATEAAAGKLLVRVEDGFIRSGGLGAALAPPASLCFAIAALPCDATRASDLETLLNTTEFPPALLQRARRLREQLNALAITKYNLVSASGPAYEALAGGRPLVVVAGQVPGDSSLALGLPCHRSNLDLLAAVRAERPDAFLVYKEHPDLVRGLRPGVSDPDMLLRHADLVVGDVDVCALIAAADEVHVATSQLGFEAVLRGRRTICHGVPFYAGWGLTEQRQALPRPRRPLTLDALVAGTLILYPRYVSTVSNLPCEVEDVVAELARRPGVPAAPGPRRERPA